jgi:type I restriction enzyme S subunit
MGNGSAFFTITESSCDDGIGGYAGMNVVTTRLSNLCKVITKGTTPTSIGYSFSDSGIVFLRVQNINGGKVNYDQQTLFIDELTHKALSRSQILAGDILVSIAGTIGRAGIVPDNAPPLNCNQAVAIVRTNEDIFRPYLRHWLESNNAQSQMIGATVTGTISNLSLTQIGNLQVPLPPLEEQKRIAEILDRAEELRSKRREAIAQLDTLTQAIFLEMFGDPLSNPNDFPIQKLGELCSRVIDCPHSTPTYATKITPYACVRSSDIQNSELIFSDVKYLELEEYKKRIERGVPQQGDVIYCREGARFGNAALVTDDTPLICLGQRMMLFRPETSKANGEFIWGYLSNPIAYHQAVREVGGSASPHINIRDIIAFQIPVPPLNRQCEFAQRISAVKKLKASHRASLSELDALFASLQHRAFRGEL